MSKCNMQFYVFGTPVTLKWGKGQQTWYDWIEVNTDKNHTKIEKLCWKCLQKKKKKVAIKILSQTENAPIISPIYNKTLHPPILLA